MISLRQSPGVSGSLRNFSSLAYSNLLGTKGYVVVVVVVSSGRSKPSACLRKMAIDESPFFKFKPSRVVSTTAPSEIKISVSFHPSQKSLILYILKKRLRKRFCMQDSNHEGSSHNSSPGTTATSEGLVIIVMDNGLYL
jgi:hypothetical protein